MESVFGEVSIVLIEEKDILVQAKLDIPGQPVLSLYTTMDQIRFQKKSDTEADDNSPHNSPQNAAHNCAAHGGAAPCPAHGKDVSGRGGSGGKSPGGNNNASGAMGASSGGAMENGNGKNGDSLLGREKKKRQSCVAFADTEDKTPDKPENEVSQPDQNPRAIRAISQKGSERSIRSQGSTPEKTKTGEGKNEEAFKTPDSKTADGQQGAKSSDGSAASSGNAVSNAGQSAKSNGTAGNNDFSVFGLSVARLLEVEFGGPMSRRLLLTGQDDLQDDSLKSHPYLELDCLYNDSKIYSKTIFALGFAFVATILQCKNTKYGISFLHFHLYNPLVGGGGSEGEVLS